MNIKKLISALPLFFMDNIDLYIILIHHFVKNTRRFTVVYLRYNLSTIGPGYSRGWLILNRTTIDRIVLTTQSSISISIKDKYVLYFNF